MTIIFHRYENGRLVENDGWHRYSRKLVEERISRQNDRVTYKALIRNEWWQPWKVWHELDLTKAKIYKKQTKQLTLFDLL